jgi:hypothetical protein
MIAVRVAASPPAVPIHNTQFIEAIERGSNRICIEDYGHKYHIRTKKFVAKI